MALSRASESIDSCGVYVDEHLIRLQYSSKLVASSAEEGRQIISQVLNASVKNNSQRHIGGLLCFNPLTMTVVQLLEGPAPAVRDLFATIMVDPRHTGCQLTNEELLFSQDEYLFGSNWGMLQSETVGHGLNRISMRTQAYSTGSCLLGTPPHPNSPQVP